MCELFSGEDDGNARYLATSCSSPSSSEDDDSVPKKGLDMASLFAAKKRPSLPINTGPEKKSKQVKDSSSRTPNTLSSKQFGKVGSHRSFYWSNSGRTVSKSSGPEDESRSSSDLSETGEESTTNGSKHTSSHVTGTKNTSTSDVEVVAVLKDVTAALNRLTKCMEKAEAQLQAVAAVSSSIGGKKWLSRLSATI